LVEQPVRVGPIPKTNSQCSQALDEGGHNERLVALGRKNALFAGSDGGARHWAMVASLIATAKLNGVEPLAWLTDVLERMVSGRTKAHELERLLPWHWKTEQLAVAVNA
jgi:transposase